jgi:trehalose 6-phosphate phosphatase
VTVDDALDVFRSAPEDALAAFDFDGTLAPIVEDPAAAAPVEGGPDALERLAGTVGEVAVVSGRPLSFLERWFPEPSEVTLVGLYGLEVRRDGRRVDHPSSGVWRETIADVADRAGRYGPSQMNTESKGLSITLHYRQHPEIADDVLAWARSAAAEAGLLVRDAKMSVELHPPIEEDKGTVLRRLAGGRSGPVLFAGDDVGDLPAFAALAELRGEGRPVVGVAVGSDESPAGLLDAADVVVDDQAAVVDLARRLAGD